MTRKTPTTRGATGVTVRKRICDLVARVARASALAAASILLIAAKAPPTAGSSAAADSLRDRCEALFTAGRYDSLLAILPAYITRAQTAGDSLLLGRAITQRGRTLFMLGRAGGERDIDSGIQIAESIADTMGLMPAVNFKGFVHWNAGRSDEAIRCFERRLFLAQRTHSPIDEGWARTSLGLAFHSLGNQERARREYERALALFHASGRTQLEISPLLGMGRIEDALGDGSAAIRWYQRAWVAARQVGDRMNEMWAANNLSVSETTQGDLSRAWQYMQHAVGLARELKSPYAMVVPAANLASRMMELGDFEAAQALLDEARALCESQGAADELPIVDYGIAWLRLQQGRNADAIAILRRMNAASGSLQPQVRDQVAVELAWALAAADSAGAAIQCLSSYLDKPASALYGAVVPPANVTLARLLLEAGDTRSALAYAAQARTAAGPARQKRVVVEAMILESRCRRALGDQEAALATFNTALDSLDATRSGIGTSEWREVYGQWVARDVVEAGRVLLEYPPTSSHAARSEAFFDAMQRVRTRALLERIIRPRSEAPEVETRWSNHVATAGDLRARLGADEVLLDFCVGVHESFVVAVTADSLRVVELPGPISSLAERVSLFRTIVASTQATFRAQYPPDRLAGVQRALGRDVLGGVADLIARASRVFVCPDGFFAAVPFGILIPADNGEVLMAGRDVVQVPSASVLVLQRAALKTGGSGRRVATISASGPGLPGARAEVQDLARRYRHVSQVDDLGSPDAFAKAAGSCDLLHIASHALVMDRSPWWSGIRLRSPQPRAAQRSEVAAEAPRAEHHDAYLSEVDSLLVERTFPSDPYVRAWQIAKLDIPARLAVLSACETAGGRMTTGEGTLGLTAAFLSAGVPVVVSSLWPVDDRVTAILMRAFYGHLAAGEPVATALRRAQLEVSRSGKYGHPYFWSGFTVVGDGSRVVPLEKRSPASNRVLLAGVGGLILLILAWTVQRRQA